MLVNQTKQWWEDLPESIAHSLFISYCYVFLSPKKTKQSLELSYSLHRYCIQFRSVARHFFLTKSNNGDWLYPSFFNNNDTNKKKEKDRKAKKNSKKKDQAKRQGCTHARTHTYIYMHISNYTQREREREQSALQISHRCTH